MKRRILLLVLVICVHQLVLGQKQTIQVSGTVTDSISSEPVTHATVAIKGTSHKTLTDDKGHFNFNFQGNFPVMILVTYTGFESREFLVEGYSSISIPLKPSGQLNEVVITAVDKRKGALMSAPVSIEYVGLRAIKNSPTPNYYNNLATKKGVDITTSSLTFNTVSTRGFNGSGSSRVNQLVDGMDNQAPGLNFFVGNFVGLTEMDVESMELLPGASSALYGPGGMNGTILINSKSPFKYQGLSIQAKQGIMHVDKSQRDKVSPYSDYSLRWAKAFNDRFAVKIGAQYISAKDWLANDSSNYLRQGNTGKVIPGTRASDPNYDGVNVYGDETRVDLRNFLAASLPANHPLMQSPIMVSRTGYAEKDMIDPETKNIKLSGALHYKLTPRLEAILMGYWATGNTVYTGNNRYVLKGINIGQYKLELRNPNWFVRSYTTQEDAGEAYSATVTAQYLNEAWKQSFNPANIPGSWYPQYTGAFMQALMSGAPMAQAHQVARAFADRDRPAAGSDQFNQIFDKVRSTPIKDKGGLFLEKSQLWLTEGQYDFSDKLKVVDFIVGGNWKKYILNSEGTLFIDTLSNITFDEIGAYAQIGKKFFNDALSLSFAGRYDKNEDFKGKFTPRATALVRVANNHNFRFSYQTAYRFPTTQQKYIRLDVGEYTLLGGLPWIMDYMHASKNPVFEMVGSTPKPFVYNEFKPESMTSFEIGYKAMIQKKLLVDVYAYMGKYRDFLGRNVLVQPSTGEVYSAVVNSTTEVKTSGFGASIEYKMRKNYNFFVNVYSDDITDVPPGFVSFFNTPKYRMNAGFGNEGLGKKQKFGFNVVWHWQDGFYSDGDLASGSISAFNTIDAMVSYKVSRNSMVKIGGSNILNHYYKNSFGNPMVGGVYYASVGFGLH
ncbi:MAG TPA: TonB-dependent receptor [Chitinophagaceae bacterium]